MGYLPVPWNKMIAFPVVILTAMIMLGVESAAAQNSSMACFHYPNRTTQPNIHTGTYMQTVDFTNACGICVKFVAVLILNGTVYPQLGIRTAQPGLSGTDTFTFDWNPAVALTSVVEARGVTAC
jgi:hypothetical protein